MPWLAPQFIPADELRSKSDAYEGTWVVTFDYQDGLPNFVYSETYPNKDTPGKWSIARCTNFIARAKTARASFDSVRTLVVGIRTEINSQIIAQGA